MQDCRIYGSSVWIITVLVLTFWKREMRLPGACNFSSLEIVEGGASLSLNGLNGSIYRLT